jgi:adenine-specific DNA-methyltransferase
VHQSSGLVTFDSAHAKICELCDHFDARRDEIMSPDYREATARAEFITPFFEALGWDVNNTAHRTIYDKDCVLEKAEAHGGTQRSADYAFRRPGTHLTAFFVEAKKPSIDIRHHDECYQAVLYGWNASTPLVVLTDFEQFLILDARSRPDKHNAASHILRENGSYTYRDYRDAEKFTEIWGLFFRQAVADGSIDKAATALPRLSGRIRRDELFGRGTRAVDDDFLAQMERWRETLAKSLKRTNQHLSGEQLTSITQRILDRLIFLRFLEDRLIERDVTFDQMGRSGSAWRDFERVSDRLDARYNGIIYKHDRHGADNPALHVHDAAFASVIEHLEPRNSDYKFATIPVTILGSIYERFLGNVIVATDKTARVEPKPEVRKAGGVYYTPDYIVRYIVDQTVGRCITKKTPKQIEEMRFADIACGSGSFLVEVFSTLIRYHLRWYIDNGAAKWEKRGILRRRETDGDHVLTLAEKRRILLNNIYGVDIDPQAVEVTQLSLYLRLLEDESFPSTQLLFDIEHRALLPDLRDNIICGNSLIENDVGDLFGLTAEEEAKIRPLDIRYAFKNIEPDKNGGMFDAVVGNPPYVRPHNIPPQTKKYLWHDYTTFVAKSDLYSCFMERAVTLLRANGRLAFIVPHTWTSLESFYKIREFLLEHSRIEQLVQLPKKVFAEATVETCIFSVLRNDNRCENDATRFEIWKLNGRGIAEKVAARRQGDIQKSHLSNFQLYRDISRSGFLARVSKDTRPLSEIVRFFYGFKTADDSKFIHPDKRYKESRRFVPSSHVKRYFIEPPEEWVWYVPEKMTRNRPTARPGDEQRFLSEKIIVARMGKNLIAAYDPGGLFVKDAMLLLPQNAASLKALTGILNSKLLRFIYRNFFTTIDVLKNALLSLPITNVGAPDRRGERIWDSLAKLVDKMLAAKKAEAEANGSRREHWARQCEALDRQIDGLVYELYGLTDKEIALVEQGR